MGVTLPRTSKLLDKYTGRPHKYNKAVLIFMPGVGEINKMLRTLTQPPFSLRHDYVIPLHGGLPPFEQKKAFRVFPGKVVITTNVAETSITIPDVTAVIDAGREKRLGLMIGGVGSGKGNDFGTTAAIRE